MVMVTKRVRSSLCMLPLLTCVLWVFAARAQDALPTMRDRVSKENPIGSGIIYAGEIPPTHLLAAAPIGPSALTLAYCTRWGCYVRTVDISGAVETHDGPAIRLFDPEPDVMVARAEITGSARPGDATVTFYRYKTEQIVARYGYLVPESRNPWVRIGPSTHASVVGWESMQLTQGLTSDEGGVPSASFYDPPLPTPPSRVTVATAGRWVLQLCRDQPSIVVYNSDDHGHSATIPAKLVPFERMYQALRTDQKDTGLSMRQTWMKEQRFSNVPADPVGVEQVLSELVTLSGDAKLAAVLKKRPVFPTTVPTVWSDLPKLGDPGKGPLP